MKNKSLIFLAFMLFIAWGCKKDDDEPTTGTVSGTVTDADTDAKLEGVKIIVFGSDSNTPVKSTTTSADGTYKFDLTPGSYYLKLYKQGYDHVPPRNITAIPFTVALSQELANPVEMNPSEIQNGGFVTGKVVEAGKGVSGALVVGTINDKGYSAVSDAEGNYYLYNLPAGSYNVKAWVAGYESEEKAVGVTASSETKQDVLLTKGAAGTVTGTISFLASNAVDTDVALIHPLTHEPVPGLNAVTSSNYSIPNVPAGTYLARATYRNDDRVVDPDWIVKFGEPVVVVNGDQVLSNFSLTGSVKVVGPTNPSTSTVPMEITETTPTFSWQAYSSASDYVIEVSDANGNIIWGGFDQTQNPPVKKITIPSSQTSIQFNSDGSATKALMPGKVYRWKIYASKNDNNPSGWKLISASEDQRGLIKVAGN